MSNIFLPPAQTRLVTIAAHVDHGKTTLADNLIEHNGIVSERLAGTIRYLDSDPEEQRRGITIRASAIGLQHTYSTKQSSQPMIIHLLDSPGHADFGAQVSSALVACDTVLLVVDAVEGMGPRTHQVFREAFVNQLVPILVINKVDRLCCNLTLTSTEAYLRLRSLLETVNAAASAVCQTGMMENSSAEELENLENLWTFDAGKGNVIFGSALFGWGFSCPQLARSLYRSKTINIKPLLLKQYLFADGKLKGDKVLKWKADDIDLPMFAEFALEPIWQIYNCVASMAAMTTSAASSRERKISSDHPDMASVLQSLSTGATGGQSPTTREALQTVLVTTGASTPEAMLRAILRRYRPLSDAILDAVCELGPSPKQASSSIRTKILRLSDESNSEAPRIAAVERIRESVATCDPSRETAMVAYVCKFMATDAIHVRDVDVPKDQGIILLGMVRVLSGVLRTGEVYHALGSNHKPSDTPPSRRIRAYLLMGSSLVRVDEVPAGHLCAVYGLEDVQLKTLTLTDDLACPPIVGLERGLRPLVKVNIEPELATDADDLERGLMRLRLADASVEVTVTARSERILSCLGELHLEQCVLDLQKIYCGREISLRISDPLVDFGETTDWFDNEFDYVEFIDDTSPPLRQTLVPPYNEEEGLAFANRGRMRCIVSGRSAAISLRVIPLADSVYHALKKGSAINESEDELLKVGRALGLMDENLQYSSEVVLSYLSEYLISLHIHGSALMETAGVRDESCILTTKTSLGEVFIPPLMSVDAPRVENQRPVNGDIREKNRNALVEAPGYKEYRALLSNMRKRPPNVSQAPRDTPGKIIWDESLQNACVAGFQMAIRAGAVCEEPVRNILVIIEGVEIAVEGAESAPEAAKPLSGGMVAAAIRAGIRCALLTRPIRLMERHLRLTLHSSLSGLGALYSVLSKRRGKVTHDSMVDGTDLIMITALIPQAEAFGLAPELHGRTSGEVTAPEMIFSHWARLDVDPFWVPTTEEEREDFGELQKAGDASTGIDNAALKYIRRVRLQKGLMSDAGRTVLAAEKQRTLKR